jgi:hypothetical protein
MKDFQPERREFLKLVFSVPVALSIGLEPGALIADVGKTALSPGSSLRKLIYLLGPWPEGEREKAEDFAGRFLKHASGPYLPGSEGLVKSLAGRFPSGAMALDSINLHDLPPEERKLLMQLLNQLYTLVEVRLDASKEPPWGECQTDRLRYTRPPG